jgi:nuclear pore complex protein Nup93
MSYVEKTLASRPAEANLGGVPSMQNKIRAFLSVKYQKLGQWSNPALEVSIASLILRDSEVKPKSSHITDRKQHADLGEDLLFTEIGAC